MDKVEFGMQVVKYTRSSFERQILESVQIQQERGHHHLLNSKSEYNRCLIPRLTAQLGRVEADRKIREEEREEREVEQRVQEEIKKRRLSPQTHKI